VDQYHSGLGFQIESSGKSNEIIVEEVLRSANCKIAQNIKLSNILSITKKICHHIMWINMHLMFK